MVSTVKKSGKIVQIIGSTFDVEFEEGHLPEIYNALKINATTAGGVNARNPATTPMSSASSRTTKWVMPGR